jgi:hypothetical protein
MKIGAHGDNDADDNNMTRYRYDDNSIYDVPVW